MRQPFSRNVVPPSTRPARPSPPPADCGVCPPRSLAAQVKMTGHMQKSSQVMAQMNKLVKVSDVQQTMQEMQKEMMRVRRTPAGRHPHLLTLPVTLPVTLPSTPSPPRCLVGGRDRGDDGRCNGRTRRRGCRGRRRCRGAPSTEPKLRRSPRVVRSRSCAPRASACPPQHPLLSIPSVSALSTHPWRAWAQRALALISSRPGQRGAW